MKKKMINSIKNKKGMSSIEFVICCMIFVLLFSFIFDLFLITYRQFTISQETTQIVRQLGKQSGIKNITPFNFPGGDENYLTTSELYKQIDDKMSGIGVDKDDWQLQIFYTPNNLSGQVGERGIVLTPAQQGFNTNYRDYITVKLTYHYKWGLWSQIIPGDKKGVTVVERSAFSEYNHDLNK